MAEYRRLRPSNEIVYPDNFGLIDCDWALEVYRTCLERGPDPERVMSGIVQYVAAHQLNNNPFSNTYESLQNALNYGRSRVGSDYILGAKALISAAFHYTLEEIDGWPADKFFVRLAQTEVIFGQVANIVNPAEKKEPRTSKFAVPPISTQSTVGDKRIPRNQQREHEIQSYVVTRKPPPQQ